MQPRWTDRNIHCICSSSDKAGEAWVALDGGRWIWRYGERGTNYLKSGCSQSLGKRSSRTGTTVLKCTRFWGVGLQQEITNPAMAFKTASSLSDLQTPGWDPSVKSRCNRSPWIDISRKSTPDSMASPLAAWLLDRQSAVSPVLLAPILPGQSPIVSPHHQQRTARHNGYFPLFFFFFFFFQSTKFTKTLPTIVWVIFLIAQVLTCVKVCMKERWVAEWSSRMAYATSKATASRSRSVKVSNPFRNRDSKSPPSMIQRWNRKTG